jgi:serine/threonine protein kinase
MEIKEFCVGSLLGEGSFSKFYKVKRKSDRKKFVLKKIDVSLAFNKKVRGCSQITISLVLTGIIINFGHISLQAASQEIAIQGLLEDSDSFVKLFGHFVAEPGIFCLLFEYCRERDLQLLVNKAKL